MSYEFPWDFAHNLPPNDQSSILQCGKSFLLQAVNFLTAHAGMTVLSSSNSVVAGAGNNCTTLNNFVPVASTGAHSWIVLESKEGAVYGLDGSGLGSQSKFWLLIDYVGAANGYAYNIYVDRFAYSGGSTTTRPRGSAYEMHLTNNPINFFSSTLGAGNTFHFQAANNDSFSLRASSIGSGIINYELTVDCLVDEPLIINPTTGISTGRYHPFGVNFRTKNFSTLGISQADIRSETNNYGWNFDGSIAANEVTVRVGANGNIIGDTTSNTGNYNGLNDCCDMVVNSTTVNKRGIAGRIADRFITGATIANNTMDPGTGAYVMMNGVWIPSPGILTL